MGALKDATAWQGEGLAWEHDQRLDARYDDNRSATRAKKRSKKCTVQQRIYRLDARSLQEVVHSGNGCREGTSSRNRDARAVSGSMQGQLRGMRRNRQKSITKTRLSSEGGVEQHSGTGHARKQGEEARRGADAGWRTQDKLLLHVEAAAGPPRPIGLAMLLARAPLPPQPRGDTPLLLPAWKLGLHHISFYACITMCGHQQRRTQAFATVEDPLIRFHDT